MSRQDVADRLQQYLEHSIRLRDLVDWAEQAMMEGDFDEAHFAAIRNAVAQLGLADVRAFGLTWEDCQQILGELGYRVQIALSKA